MSCYRRKSEKLFRPRLQVIEACTWAQQNDEQEEPGKYKLVYVVARMYAVPKAIDSKKERDYLFETT